MNVKIKTDQKPKCKLVGTDGNIFALVGKASKVLESKKAKEMSARIFFQAKSYEEALAIIAEYVRII